LNTGLANGERYDYTDAALPAAAKKKMAGAQESALVQ
jgi:hypothetical protein